MNENLFSNSMMFIKQCRLNTPIIQISIIIFLSTFLSCTKDDENLTERYTLKRKEYCYLPIDNSTPVSTTHMIYFEKNDQKLLYTLNTAKQRIQVYDWETKKLTEKIQLDKEGPNGIGYANSFYLENKDSIYILSSYTYRLSLINHFGKIINKYTLLERNTKFDTLTLALPQGGYSVLALGNSSNPLFKLNNKIITGAYPNLDFRTEKYFKDGKSGLCLNTETGQINYIMQYPKKYLDLFKEGYRFPGQFTWSGLTFNKEKHIAITSYPADENLYITDVNTYETTSIPVRSRFFSKVKLLNKNPKNPKEEFDFAVSNDCFDAIYYDPYRKIYIRYVLHPNPKKKDQFDDHSWLLLSIILLDKNFNRMGETMLEEGMPGGAIFFRKDGIYMQKYDRKQENKLTFVRYELSKN